MADEEYDSDTTVLLTDYYDKPEKIDAKRRRLSKTQDKIHADEYKDDEDFEEDNTAPDAASDNTQTKNSKKQNNNVDKNLLLTKYLAGLSEVKIENNEQKELDSENGRNLITNATFHNDDIICLDTDDEAQINDENEKTEDENVNNNGHKIDGDKNILTENNNNYGKLKVLKPAAINARRTTVHVFEPTVLDDSFRLDNNKKDTIEVTKSSAITSRRATTSFEESCFNSNTNERRNISEKCDMQSKKRKNDSNNIYNEETKQADESNAINNSNIKNKNILGQSYNEAVTSSDITVDTKNFKANSNNPISNEDILSSQPKRARIETSSKCTQLELKNSIHNNEMDNTIENKENENVNNTHREQERTEACHEPNQTYLEGLNLITLGMGDKQVSCRFNAKEMRREVQREQQVSEGRDLKGTSKIEDQKKIREVRKYISTVHTDQGTCKARGEDVINDSHDKQNKTIVQGDQEMSTLQDTQNTYVVPNETEISRVQNDQGICRARSEDVINESPDKQKKTIVQSDQEMSTLQDRQDANVVPNETEISRVQNYKRCSDEVINQSHDKQNETIVQGDQEMSTLQDTQNTYVVPNETEISRVQNDQGICRARSEDVINESPDKQKKTIVQGDQEMSTLQDRQDTNVVPNETEISRVQNYKGCSEEVINQSHDKQNETIVQGDQEMSTLQDTQNTYVVPNETEISRVQNDQGICRARSEDVINESPDKQKKTIVQGDQEMSTLQDRQDTNVVPNETEISRVQNYKGCSEEVINQSHDKQNETIVQSDPEISIVQDIQETNVVPDEQAIGKTRNGQIKNKSQNKQDNPKLNDKQGMSVVPVEQEICKSTNEHVINDAYDKQDKHKVQSEQNISTTQAQNGIIEVQDKEVVSNKANETDKQVQYVERTSKVCNKQETKKKNDEQNTSEAVNEKNEITRKLSSGGDKRLMVSFQVQFFTSVIKFIKKWYPESAMILHSLIQSLETHAENGIVQSDIKYCCPKCEHVSTYSSRLLNNTDDFRKCSLCQKLTDLHRFFMKRYLEEVEAALNKMKNKVNNNSQMACNKPSSVGEVNSNMLTTNNPEVIVHQDTEKTREEETLCEETSSQTINVFKEKVKFTQPKPSYVNVEGLHKNEPVITKKRVGNECMIDSKRKKLDAKHNDAQHLTSFNISPSKDTGSSSSFDSNFQSNNNQNAVPAITQAINESYDERQNKVIILSVKDVTPLGVSGINCERHNGQSKIETEINIGRVSTNENTPDKLTNNLQTKSKRNENIPDSGLHSKNNLTAVGKAEECSEKDSKKTTNDVNDVGGEKASSTLDGQNARRVSQNSNEEVGTYKPGDNLSDSAPPKRPENENYSDPNMETTNSKEIDNSNETTLKLLENTFNRLRNNSNTEQIENKKAKAQQETNIAKPVSASNRDNRLDIQPNCDLTKKKIVQYICKFCSCEYVHAGKLIRHMKTNHNAKDTTIPENCIRRKCVFCNESMNNKNYNNHVKKYHPDKFTKNVATNENSDINEDGSGIIENNRVIPRSSNEMTKTSEPSSFKYLCSICEEILTTDYASRQHRKEKHPEFKNQQIYKKVIIKGKHEQDGIHNDENVEIGAVDNVRNMSSELESDNDADTNTSKVDGHCSTKENELRCRNDANHSPEAHNGQSSTTTSTMVSRNDTNDNNDGSDDITTTDASKYKYQCSICNEILSNYYASRLHRKQEHPELKYRQIYKKVTIKDKNDDEIYDDDNEILDAEDNVQDTSDSEDDSEVVTSGKEVDRHDPTSNKHFQDQTEENRVRSTNDANYNQHTLANNSGTTSANTVGRNDNDCNVAITEASKYKFHCSICDEILSNDYASRQHRKQKHPELKYRQIYKKVILKGKKEQDGGELSSSGDSDLDNNEESNDDDESLNGNDNDHVVSEADDEGIEGSDGDESDDTNKCNDNNMNNAKSTQYACALCKERFPSYYAARKHRIEKHAKMNRAHLIIKIQDDAATSNDQSSNRKIINQLPRHDRSSSSDNEETSNNEETSDNEAIQDDNDKSVPPRHYDNEENNSDEALKASGHTIKNMSDFNVKLYSDENEASARPDLNQEKSNQEARRKRNNHQMENTTVNSANNSSEIEEASEEEESIKVSERTAKKKKERISKLFGDDIDISIQTNKSDCNREVKSNNTKHTNHLKPTDVESKTKDENFSDENVERESIVENCETDISYHENAKETSIHINDRNGYKAIKASELEINGKNKIDILHNTRNTIQNDDRIEIDMINRLLGEENSKPSQTIQNKNSEDINNDDPATTASQIRDDEKQNNEKYQFQTENLSVKMPDKTCLDNIKITNVTSMGAKLYIYVCQECLYATDDYDTAIHHCQNHYNNIDDPVTYCQICQIKYDVPCFERHESSHDKYLKSVKINFSYKWLFANWQRVFENNDMVLTDAEDMQVKSIYKTFCIKMAVKQDGPWQTSLYLCCKCNTCVSPRDIENHVQQTCPLNNFSCSVCNYAFLTNDMKQHHESYHKDDESKLFKIIVFNDKVDESFNLKLFQAKALVKNEGNPGFTDIFKCLCGLCFVSLKNLKLHFAECEEQINNAVDCPDCTVLRQFLPKELVSHRSLHHGTAKYEFKVHRIVIQEETNISDNSEADCNIPEPEKEDEAQVEIEDLNVHNDLLIDETLTQNSKEDGSDGHPGSVERNGNNLAARRDMTSDESLTQNTNDNDDQRYPENIELNDVDLAVEREMLNAETFTQTTNQEDSQKDPESDEINEADLAVKRDMLKDETLTQTTNEEASQKNPESVESNKEDLAVKRDMLKDETLTQITNEDFEQRDSESAKLTEEHISFDRDMLNDKTLTQTSNENGGQKDSESAELNEEKVAVENHALNNESFRQYTNEDNHQSNTESREFILNAETLTEAIITNEGAHELVELSDDEDDVDNEAVNPREIMDVDDSEPPIPIGDSDSDSDIEIIECPNLSSNNYNGTLQHST